MFLESCLANLADPYSCFKQFQIGLARIRHSIKGRGLDDILQLPNIEDEKIIATLRLLLLVARSSIKNPELISLLSFRALQLNLTHGSSKTMPVALAFYGLILNKLGFVKESMRYGEMAISLQVSLSLDANEALSPFMMNMKIQYSYTLTLHGILIRINSSAKIILPFWHVVLMAVRLPERRG